MTQKISLHRVLSELKLINKKIDDKIFNYEPITVKKANKLVNNENEEQFVKDAKAGFESIEALIQRRVDLKNALIMANATHNVVVNGKSMTLAEAIDYKTVNDYKKTLLKQLKDRYVKAVRLYGSMEEKINSSLDDLIKTAVGSQDNGTKSDSVISAVTEGFMLKNKLEYVDPISVKEQIDKLQTEIDDFESEIDSVLSEANASILVEV